VRTKVDRTFVVRKYAAIPNCVVIFVVRRNSIRTNAIRTNEIRTNAIRTNAIRTNVAKNISLKKC